MTCPPWYIPTVINLFGPVDFTAALTETLPGDMFRWPGSCDTAHIAVFQSEYVLAPLKRALWRMCVAQPAGRSIFQLVTCNDGPSNVQGVSWIDTDDKPAGIAVWNTAQDVTAAVNAFLAANCDRECNVGWQAKGDNTHPFSVFACRLELTFEIGAP